MPCARCGSQRLYFLDEPLCPVCDKITTIPTNDALAIVSHFIDEYRAPLLEEIRRFSKDEILVQVFWERDKVIRQFYTSYSTINPEKLATCNLLLKRVIKMDGFLNSLSVTELEATRIVDGYETIVRLESILEQVEAGSTLILKTIHYDLSRLHNLSLRDVFYCQTEEYQKIKKIFEKFSIMPEEQAKKKMDEWQTQLEPVIPGSKRSMNATETIARFFEVISNWYTGLFSNKLYRLAFGLPRWEEITIKPFDLKLFATSYQPKDNEVIRINYSDFFRQATTFFKEGAQQVVEHFTLSEMHSEANPLFLRLGESVLVSPHFTEFFSYVLHAILDKDIFDKEVEKRSRLFESDVVRAEFEKQGFTYLLNQGIKDKMQIDGIAISDSKVYVIEAKGWKAKDLLQDRFTREILADEIRNAIDGLHYSRKTDKTEKKVSLPDKVEWVKKERTRFGISSNADVIGVLVINREPVISEYKGCIVKYVDDFEFN